MIISISGKKQSGKDTVCKIIQYLTTGGMETYIGDTIEESVLEFIKYHSDCLNEDGSENMPWQRKLFADKLKDIVCLLIGCTREQLEDVKFKEKPLGEEWNQWVWTHYKFATSSNPLGRISGIYSSKGEAELALSCGSPIKDVFQGGILQSVIMTPRLMLQLIGTECGRQIINPNIWVNALMSEYISSKTRLIQQKKVAKMSENNSLPNWIITDTRFPNEIEAIEKRKGLTIRIKRMYTTTGGNGIPATFSQTQFHESETALDNYKDWDAVIDNNDSIKDLIVKVEIILKQFKII